MQTELSKFRQKLLVGAVCFPLIILSASGIDASANTANKNEKSTQETLSDERVEVVFNSHCGIEFEADDKVELHIPVEIDSAGRPKQSGEAYVTGAVKYTVKYPACGIIRVTKVPKGNLPKE